MPLRRHLPALTAALATAAIRLPFLGWGLPRIEEEAYPLKKAFAMWGWETGRLQLDPQTAGWPALSFYVHLGLQHLHYLLGRLTGAFADRYDYYVDYLVDPGGAVRMARALGVAAAAVAAFVVFRLAERLAGRAAAVASTALLAVSPLLMRHSLLITPDILLLACAALATARIVALGESGRRTDYLLAGLWIGLGAACKYTPVLLLLSLGAVHLLRARREGMPLLRDARPWLAAVAAAAAFLAASPFTLSDLATLQRDVAYQALHMGRGHFGHGGRPVGYLYYLQGVVLPGLGWTGGLLGLVGLVAAAWRLRGPWLALLLCAAPFYLVLGAFRTTFDRYMLPVLPVLALGLAGLWTVVAPRLGALPAPGRRAVALGLALLAVLPAALGAARVGAELHRTSTQAEAEAWIRRELDPARDRLALERYTVELPSSYFLRFAERSGLLARLSAAQQQRLRERSFYSYVLVPLYSTLAELTAPYYDLRLYRGCRWIVTSSAVRDRYEAEPARFPRQLAFYADLERFGTLVRTFAADAGRRGPELRAYSMDEVAWARLRDARGPLPREPAASRHGEIDLAQHRTFLEAVARLAYESGHFVEAEVLYSALFAALDRARQDQLAWRLGLLKIQTERWAEARELFRRWLQHRPGDAGALANLGLVAQAQGRTDEARELYRQAVAADPGGATADWARARLAELAGTVPGN